MSDLAVARFMGWRYEWVAELDAAAYDVLLEQIAEFEKVRSADGSQSHL